MFVVMPGWPTDKPTKWPTCGSLWKLENGQWFWYVDPDKVATPFGEAKLTTRNGPGGSSLPVSIPGSIDELRRKVEPDKKGVLLNSKQASSDEVLIANGLEGAITLHVEPHSVPGLSVTLDKKEVKPHEKAKLQFAFEPSQQGTARAAEVKVIIDSLVGMVIPIQVNFQ